MNELVVLLIRDIAHREFVLGEWGEGVSLREIESHRDRIPEFQKQILEWYKQNKDKTSEERKIADLDSNLRNRLDAATWLGYKKSVKAVPLLVKRIGSILGGREDSCTRGELANASLALGRIGDPKALPAVTKACDHLAGSSPRWPGSGALDDLFAAYHGMALLGHKKDALAELKRIYEDHKSEMEPHRQTEYQEHLEKAAKW